MPDPATTPCEAGFPGETYVLGRLGFGGRRRVPLLDALSLAAAIPLVERVGAMRLHGRRARSDARLVDAGPLLSAGMAAFEGGPSPFRSFLDGLVATARPDRDELTPGVAYGRLYGWLVHDERDPAYGPVREALRAHAIASLPLQPGRDLLGRPVTEPVLGTVARLSRVTGLEKATVERLLASLGAVPAPGPSPIPLYAAADCARLADLAAATCWSAEARRALGLTNEGMASVVSAGCLVPVLPRHGREVREDRFDRAAVERLAVGVFTGVPRLRDVPAGCAPLPEAARRGMSSIGSIVRAVLDGRLAPGDGCAAGPGSPAWSSGSPTSRRCNGRPATTSPGRRSWPGSATAGSRGPWSRRAGSGCAARPAASGTGTGARWRARTGRSSGRASCPPASWRAPRGRLRRRWRGGCRGPGSGRPSGPGRPAARRSIAGRTSEPSRARRRPHGGDGRRDPGLEWAPDRSCARPPGPWPTGCQEPAAAQRHRAPRNGARPRPSVRHRSEPAVGAAGRPRRRSTAAPTTGSVEAAQPMVFAGGCGLSWAQRRAIRAVDRPAPGFPRGTRKALSAGPSLDRTRVGGQVRRAPGAHGGSSTARWR
ncbi:hypothetical protein [Methylobacterium tardum]|uniref:hypothetical protein n=1 Tax=Methylobacterium tardum TaxID=374432 RepID=UPI00361979FB